MKARKRKRTKFETGVSWIKISFPSAKDPTFSTRHGSDVTTCVVTIEADDDFVMPFDTKPKLFSIFKDRAGDAGNRQRLLDRVQKDLTMLRFAGHFIGASVTIQSVARRREFAPILRIPVCSWEDLI
jgi:hypothetical protein